MLARPLVLLRLEGLALLLAAVVLYAVQGASWWLFAVLLFAPDLGMLGYLRGERVGAVTYNLAHFTVLPLVTALVGLMTGAQLPVSIALIWLAHIGLDRAFGYGLKLPTGFKDTHLGSIGNRRGDGGA